MAIPTLILSRVKDKLRIPELVETWDAAIMVNYEIELKELLLQSDFLVESEPIAAVADQSIYPLSERTVRLLALFHNQLALARVPSRTQDLLTEWETEASDTPEEFTLDHLPLRVDNLSAALPEQVLVRPAPADDASGDEGLIAWEVALPANEAAALILPYLVPYLVYRTAARVLAQDLEIRDLPASQLWGQIAEMWFRIIQTRVP